VQQQVLKSSQHRLQALEPMSQQVSLPDLGMLLGMKNPISH
jgi:hypothetical protein